MTKSHYSPISSLYVLKGICAILVVLLHTSIGEFTYDINIFGRDLGLTSIFYAITGYFLYHPNIEVQQQRIIKSIKKIIPIIIITHFVYLFTRFPLPDFTLENKIFYFKWLILGDGGALWYLTALLHGLIFIWIFNHFCIGKYISLLLLFIFVRFICEDYWEFFFNSPRTNLEKNAIAYSIPMMAMGLLVKKYENKLLSLTPIRFKASSF